MASIGDQDLRIALGFIQKKKKKNITNFILR